MQWRASIKCDNGFKATITHSDLSELAKLLDRLQESCEEVSYTIRKEKKDAV